MLLGMDSTDHYATAELVAPGSKWTTVVSSQCTWTIAANGRTGNAINRTATGVGGSGSIALAPLATRLGPWTPTNSGGCAFAVNMNALTQFQSDPRFFEVVAGTTTLFYVQIQANGTFFVFSGDSVPVFQGLSAEGLVSSTWMHFEIQWTIGATTGAVAIWVNNVRVCNLSNIRTVSNQTAATVWNGVRLFRIPYNLLTPDTPLIKMRDFVLYDRASAVSGDISNRVGDTRVVIRVPDGVGNYSGWTPSAGNNWQCVDEVPPNEDTDYIETTAPGTVDTYQIQDLTAAPLAIQIVTYARKDGADGSAMIAPRIRISGTDYDGVPLGVSSILDYFFLVNPQDVSPATLAAWGLAEFNAAEIGPLKDA